MNEKILIAGAVLLIAIVAIAILASVYTVLLYLMIHQPYITAAIAPAYLVRWFYQECFTV